MKKSHIVLLLLIVAAIAVIVSSFGSFSSYETFATASLHQGKKLYVIGYLQKDTGLITRDENHFIFYAKDKAGEVHKVVFNGDKPRDIEKSEQIVMMGYDDAGTFRCSRIQMKCPSKYKKDMVVEGKEG
jgi:cytochrome c-type biogenesis protein CcmE